MDETILPPIFTSPPIPAPPEELMVPPIFISPPIPAPPTSTNAPDAVPVLGDVLEIIMLLFTVKYPVAPSTYIAPLAMDIPPEISTPPAIISAVGDVLLMITSF